MFLRIRQYAGKVYDNRLVEPYATYINVKHIEDIKTSNDLLIIRTGIMQYSFRYSNATNAQKATSHVLDFANRCLHMRNLFPSREIGDVPTEKELS